jgi:hypothetical protein
VAEFEERVWLLAAVDHQPSMIFREKTEGPVTIVYVIK